MMSELPPWEKNGKAIPLLGSKPETTPKLTNAWIAIKNVKIEAIKKLPRF
jgi:hypothetical protein